MRLWLYVALYFLALQPCLNANAQTLAGRDPSAPFLNRRELTIWKLKEMAEGGRTAELEEMFNHGLSLGRLPVGYSAGVASWTSANLLINVLDALTGDFWRGKIFFSSTDRGKSVGLNRVREDFLDSEAPIVPMAAFEAQLVESHELAPSATSNLVTLNYAQPTTKPYWQETALTQIQVFDLMVAVRGKYGPLYLGKTWLGTYDSQKRFVADDPGNPIAWFFLDFNQGAVDEQLARHWDGAPEARVDYATCNRVIQFKRGSCALIDPRADAESVTWRLSSGF